MKPTLVLGSDAMRYSTMQGRIHPRLLDNAKTIGYEFMSPVQQAVLTQLPSFETDCLVQAKTGTGKTTAFLMPILHNIMSSKKPVPRGQVSALIMSPTRELAEQIRKECDSLTAKSIDCHVAYGGTAKDSNLNKFMRGSPTVLVATPGRLLDYLSEAKVRAKFSDMRTVVLDEADTMLEAGMYKDIKSILDLLPPKGNGWQGMCFSATIKAQTKEVLDCVLSKNYTSLSTIDASEPPTVEKVPQTHIIIPSFTDSFKVMKALLDRESAEPSKIIVFGATANLVALYHDLFTQNLSSQPVFEMHSRLSQSKRTKITADFKAAKSGIMFASDVIGRGMDFPNVDVVIQAGLPPDADQYVHRVGRTGRADATGRAVIMLTQKESFFLKKFPKLPIHSHPETAPILAEAGAKGPLVDRAMDAVDPASKQKAYSATLGNWNGSVWLKFMGLNKADLVVMVNDFATNALRCEIPALSKKLIGKMGFKGIPGLVIEQDGAVGGQDRGQQNARPNGNDRSGRSAQQQSKPRQNGAGRGNGQQGNGSTQNGPSRKRTRAQAS